MSKQENHNDKIAESYKIDNYDYTEIPEIYIASGLLTDAQAAYLRDRMEELKRVKDHCDGPSLFSMIAANEAAIKNHFGEMTYTKNKTKMQVNFKEYCRRFIESYDKRFTKKDSNAAARWLNAFFIRRSKNK
jgi:hypothetical protein